MPRFANFTYSYNYVYEQKLNRLIFNNVIAYQTIVTLDQILDTYHQ